MSVQVKHRRDTATNVAAYTLAQGEIGVDTTNNRAVVGDGTTAGGWPAALESRRAISDAATTILATDRLVVWTALTATRGATLCAAANYPPGAVLRFGDETGNCSSTKQIRVTAAGTDAINGFAGGSVSIASAWGFLEMESNGVNAWTVVNQTSPQSTTMLAQSAFGALCQIVTLEQLVSGLTGASVNAATAIPANALVLACTGRVTTTITGPTSFSVNSTIGGVGAVFASGVALTAGTTFVGPISPTTGNTASTITISATGSNFTAGAVRLSTTYMTFGAPTS